MFASLPQLAAEKFAQLVDRLPEINPADHVSVLKEEDRVVEGPWFAVAPLRDEETLLGVGVVVGPYSLAVHRKI